MFRATILGLRALPTTSSLSHAIQVLRSLGRPFLLVSYRILPGPGPWAPQGELLGPGAGPG